MFHVSLSGMKGDNWADFGSLIILLQVNNVRLLILLLKDAFTEDVLKGEIFKIILINKSNIG